MKPDQIAYVEIAAPHQECCRCETYTTRAVQVSFLRNNIELDTKVDIPLCEDHCTFDLALQTLRESVQN